MALSKWAINNPEKYKESKRRDYEKHREAYIARAKARYEANKPQILDEMKVYNAKNVDKRRVKNRGYQQYRNIALSKGCILKGDEWNDFVIQEMEELRNIRNSETGFKWEIDHIIPVKHKLITGLHVWYNLQLIPRSMNKAKHNKLNLTLNAFGGF